MKRICILLILFLVGCSPLRSEFYRNQADFLYTEATRAYSAGKFDEAKKGYAEVITLDPAYSEAYVGLGHCAMIRGSRKEALACYEQALALDPKLRPKLEDIICAASLGEQSPPKTFAAHHLEKLFNQGRDQEIVGVRRDKGLLSEMDYFWLIRSLVRLGDYRGAAAVVRRMFADQSSLEEVTEKVKHLDSFLSQGHAEALADFQTLADMNPDCQACQYLYGIILFNNSSQYDEVIKRFERLHRTGYSPKSLLVVLAMAYEKQDMPIEAVETYQQLGDDLIVYERLRQLFIKLGDMEEVEFYEEQIQAMSSSSQKRPVLRP